MASVTASLHTTLVTKVAGSTLAYLTMATATTTTYTNWNDLVTSSSQTKSSLTETINQTVITTPTPHPTSPSTPSQKGTTQPSTHRFPTALVATLLSLFSLAVLATLLSYLHHTNHLHFPPPLSKRAKPTPEDPYVWSTYGLVRQSSLERSKKRHRLRDQTPGDEDPVAVAIRREEQGERKKREESEFYAPQVRHLVQLLGSKEEVRVNVEGQLKRAKSWRWGRGKGMSSEEVQRGGGV